MTYSYISSLNKIPTKAQKFKFASKYSQLTLNKQKIDKNQTRKQQKQLKEKNLFHK